MTLNSGASGAPSIPANDALLQLRTWIADKQLLPGGRLPAERELARRLGVTHTTAVKSIARLKREGLATSRPYRGVFLTPAGEAMAKRVRARHRLIVDLLLAVGVPPEAAESDAEGMEHYASEASLEAFARFLKNRR